MQAIAQSITRPKANRRAYPQLLLCASLLLAIPVGGQVLPPTQSGTILVDVAVTAKNGNPVTGLSQSGFKIYEDGRLQKIVSFQAINQGAPSTKVGSGTISGLAGWQGSRTIFLLDDLSSTFLARARAEEALKKYFRQNNGQLGQPVMLMALTQYGLTLLHDYTTNGSELQAALHELPPHLRTTSQVSYSTREAGVYHGDFVALSQIAESASGLPGHKTLVWITSAGRWGFSGKRSRIHLADLIRRSRITLDVLNPQEPDMFRRPTDNLKRVEAGGAVAGAEGLASYAMETGGKVTNGTNQISDDLQQSVTQATNYYTLQYIPNDKLLDGRFRRIEVEVDNPGLTVHTRLGYYALP